MRTLQTLALILLAACSGGDRYHANGFSRPDRHGAELRMGVQDCTACHGADLTGGGSGAPSCDRCHEDGWRTNCTFCHGGDENDSGAPPRGLDDAVDPSTLAFWAHSTHVRGDRHMAFDCAECHVQPSDVLSDGHVFDTTPGVAEVDFGAGLSPMAVWDGSGGCSSLYCHGTGRQDVGAASSSTANLACNSCHPSHASSSGWSQMSGKHSKHLREGVGCEACHADTVSNSETISQPELHVNGAPDVQFNVAAVTRSPSGTCSGVCHGEYHTNERW